MSLHFGYAQKSITPSLTRPVYLAGFGQNRVAQSVHDDLYVRALALQQGETRLVLAALDLIGLGRPHCLEIERRVNEHAPNTRTLIACTHTHHAPDTIGLWGPDQFTRGVDEAYLATLKDRIVETVLTAIQLRQSAPRLCATSVHVQGLAKNARDPQVVDDELTCLQFRDEADKPLATLLIFPCHPEVLWEDNPHITSDYVYTLRREVEAATAAPCLFFAGALGGMMTPDVKEHSFEEAEAMGMTLAKAALEALGDPQCLTRIDQHRLNHKQHDYAIPMKSPLFDLAIQGGLLLNPLQDGAVFTEANLLKVGPVWLATAPGELLPKLGLQIKAELREAGGRVSAVIGLVNDELGYILPLEDYAYPEDPFEPGAHYEETMSIGPEAGPRWMAAVQALLAEDEH